MAGEGAQPVGGRPGSPLPCARSSISRTIRRDVVRAPPARCACGWLGRHSSAPLSVRAPRCVTFMGTEGLRAGIKAEGLEEGRDVRFDVRSTGAEERTVAPLAAALARENPDVIVGPLAPVVAEPRPESRC